MTRRSVFKQLTEERTQGHGTRKKLFKALEKELNLPVATFFTSFYFPVNITTDDADMLQEILQEMDLSKGLALVVSSPGGYPLAAESIIRTCRSYSGTGTFTAIVPGAAKSAATMICMGAERIVMGPTSELGPVDPQMVKEDSGQRKSLSVYNIVKSYEELFGKAVKEEGNIEPYLHQLAHYDPMDIQELRSYLELSEDISTKALESGMMSGLAEKTIKNKIGPFLEPRTKKVHGRAIYAEEAKKCGLSVEEWSVHEPRWAILHELYLRTESVVKMNALKVLETSQDSWILPAHQGG